MTTSHYVAEIRAWLEDHQDEMIAALQEQLRIPSKEGPPEPAAPFGRECRRALDHALSLAQSAGFRTKDLDGYAGHAEFGDGDEVVMALGHLDVVPEGSGWRYDPFGAEIVDGYIYARGALDDKGPTYAAFYGARAIKELGLPIRRRIRIVFGCNEESGFRCVKYYFEHEEKPTYGFAPDADWPLVYAEKGVANLVLTKQLGAREGLRVVSARGGERGNIVPDAAEAVLEGSQQELDSAAAALSDYWDANVAFRRENGKLIVQSRGKSAHASTPFLGDNAVTRLLRALREIGAEPGQSWLDAAFRAADLAGVGLGLHGRDEIVGDLTSNLGILRIEDTRLTLQFNIRYPVQWTADMLIKKVEPFVEQSGFEIASFSDNPPLYVPTDREPVKTILAVLEEEFGEPQVPKTMGGGTYARAVPNTVAVGTDWPGDGLPHEANERYAVSSYLRAAGIYAHILLRLAE